MTYAPFNLTGKVCVVTGGNKGIGLGMAEALAASNADVVIWGRKAEDNDAAVKKLEGLGTGRAKAWQVDVADEDAVIKAMAESEEEFGRIDTCIANAGVGRGASSFEEMSLDTWRFNQRINSEGAFLTLREAAKSMVNRAKAGDPGGSLVGTASLAALSGAARNQAYGHTKGGLIAMMNAIAVEYGRYKIRANSVLPGWIATDMTEGGQGSDVFNSKVISRVPIRRWGEPEDFGGIAVYLASDASKFHSGDTLLIDGAYSKF
ncbi:SDR family NAD(P)-dependent oxidoreductase [Hyphomonas pacifica]|uniref:2-deoxy-D-gluconate 3-dehydrogenase n=1 Tax=Hyphomonas pacifica TaxID=1280941 RepID=A0A062TVI5_9PROT|nr:SDR family oxidoreductase [Hyphomonas pacifica]KCZ47354.1 2-deoxy-D-gluconate 3-dehydrogenase [Hyphomonas pacifica]RAN31270.1 2-deoxy-D-gluconate 3-dehydrogenase [Hyphomonas pacifica]RAN38330.1 2-deoxy-D-gluconate 3-dehydrogenase [Hyphomonas pacifica]